ncbi:MAG TPA: TIGR01777 family oxidoreductase [Mycobacteriales bacterium]|nr:TIGR01777 family oxidoreductase [Mycobacteriales bacterium]
MKVAVTGSSGFIGSALVPSLRAHGHAVLRIVRRPPQGPDEVRWNPERHELDPAVLSDVDAVVHLAGVGVGDRRWSAQHKRAILSSRIDGTTTVSEAVAGAGPRPRALLSSSGVDWYADLGDRPVDETGPPGGSYLAEVCRQWEAATVAAEQAGVRVAHLRTGLVCGPRGGLVGRLLPLVKLGVGGRLASGEQYWSWISLADQVGGIEHVLGRDEITGPVNLTGPNPVTNAEFTRALGEVLSRPTVLPVPAFALRIAVGEFADEGIISGHRVLPRVLERTGYRFQHDTAEKALRWATGRP